MSGADKLRESEKLRKFQPPQRSKENEEAMRQAHTQILNERSHEPTNERTFVPSNAKVERRRFSFDLRPELHRELKMQCLIDDSNMYEVVESLIENYLMERKSGR